MKVRESMRRLGKVGWRSDGSARAFRTVQTASRAWRRRVRAHSSGQTVSLARRVRWRVR